MRHSATIVLGSLLLIASGYAIGVGALWFALPTIAAVLLVLPFARGTPSSHSGTGRRVAESAPRTALRAEIARSRRHNRSFALIRVPHFPSSVGALADDARSSGFESGAVRAQVRIVDHVWSEPDALYVLLPESGLEDVGTVLTRLEARLNLEGRLVTRSAIYPNDGPTEAAIMQRLRGRDPATVGSAPETTELLDELLDPRSPLAS